MFREIRSMWVGVTMCLALSAGAQGPGSGKVDRNAAEHAADAATVDTTSSTIELSGSGRHETIACTGGTEVAINGSDNNITLSGDCKSVSVTGSTNQVTAEGMGALSVIGSDNTVTWKHALGKAQKPKVSTTGSGNRVSKVK
jgi:hypothetical protein